ncbi:MULTISPECIES: KH domain-containing protein [unclassified Campylobacter]|uniref:KH domain-containing protein n=1 Tax=unclassified Campylobacter TaxID=2593542 RepID=UPI001B2ED898|nr:MULTISPECIES: KH domain-containing protein [unclassified Campylobacter]MBO7370126.1 KH domain-containing protein [Campylobacter sp.]MBO7475710.1 KH domain-containing protein [Campylobacter sp.]MBP3206908.1 KH domain-containing protein [Campylobacter sp.]MBP5778603.1 KH domain-containing protein [Campylobacter sp.]MBQ2431292.1 KH domain-containing protein [Campylobacter sp.]
MVENFLKQYAIMIADYPNSVRTEKNVSEEFTEIIIYADKADTGKLIGKDGKMINAIKTVILGYKAKDPTQYKITVKAADA